MRTVEGRRSPVLRRIGFQTFAFALALPILRPPSALATMARLTDDTYTKLGDPGKNGAQNVLKLQGATQPLKPFIKFDLSTVPAGTTGAEVEKATLSLFVDSVNTPGTFNVAAVNTPDWDEATLSGQNEPSLYAPLPENTALTVSTKRLRVAFSTSAPVVPAGTVERSNLMKGFRGCRP